MVVCMVAFKFDLSAACSEIGSWQTGVGFRLQGLGSYLNPEPYTST